MFAMISLTWTVFNYQLTVLQLQLHIFNRATLASAGISCWCVCLSQVGVPLKWINVGSRKQRHTIARDFSFLMPKISAKLKWGQPQLRHQMQVG